MGVYKCRLSIAVRNPLPSQLTIAIVAFGGTRGPRQQWAAVMVVVLLYRPVPGCADMTIYQDGNIKTEASHLLVKNDKP